jgi:hypothetical protein
MTDTKPPLYWRLLRLRTIHPNGWQRAILVEGVGALAVVLVLADAASAWTLLALPLVAAAVVKGHDVLASMLPARKADLEAPGAEPVEGVRGVDEPRTALQRLRL